MWLDSFQSLSLHDSPPNPKLNRSMSLNELAPQKRIKLEKKLRSSPSGTVYRQFSYEELGVVPGTSSLRLSKKFVQELHVDFSDSKNFEEFSRIKNYSECNSENYTDKNREIGNKNTRLSSPCELVDLDLQKCSGESEGIFSANSMSGGEPRLFKMTQRKKRSDIKEGVKRKRLLRLVPNRFTSVSTESVNGLLSETKKANEGKNSSSSNTLSCVLWIILPVFVIIIATLGTQFVIHRKTCDTKFDFDSMEYLLSTNIFGQEIAVKKIVDSFKNFYTSEQDGLKVLVFTGNTGVGKTFTASMLEEIFPWRFNIHHFVMPVDLGKLPRDSLYNYPYCGDHLVILDNLREEDVKDATEIVSYLKKLAAPKRVVAILIFKFHKQITEIPSQMEMLKKGSEIQSKLSESGIENEIVNFKDLDKKAVVQCIKEALSRHWIPVSENTINIILEQVDYRREGCKRISSKIAVVNDIWVKNE